VRTGFIFFNLDNTSQIPAVAEPWFLAFHSHVEIHPAMNLEDLKNATPGIENAVKKYSHAARAARA
jgi:hypothetical protein